MGPHLTKPESIQSLPYFPSGTSSLLCKTLTPDVWTKCKDISDKYGYSFKQAIYSGCKWTNSGIGVYVGSHDGYYDFAPLLDKVIEQYHKHTPQDKHVSNMDYTKLDCPEFTEEEDKMIISTRIRVARNLADYPLGTAVTALQRRDIEEKVVSALKSLDGELKGTYYSLDNMTDDNKNQLISDHFLFKGGDKYLQSCGLEREWPEARGIFHNDNKTFLVWVNEEDQLRIIAMQPGSNISQVFKRLSIAAAKIEKIAKFAHDDHLGYITSCPTNLGTGMRASVHIKLPKLAQQPEKFEHIADKHYVQIRGIHGEHSESAEGIFDISNKRRLGRSEVDLVQDMYNGIKAMIEMEKSL